MNFFQTIPARVYLLIAVTIFGAASAITHQLTELGAENLMNGRNPISFCNVLFVGNIWALIALTFIYYKDWNPQTLRQLSSQDWLSLTVVALLSGALAPALMFSALEHTTVNNVILVGRIEPPLALVLAIFFLKARVNSWVVAGALVSFLGVGLTLLITKPQTPMMPVMGLQMGLGEVLAIGGAVAGAIAAVISKASLQRVPLGVFSLYRTAVGTVIFFVIVIRIFGWHHFTDVFSPFVWRWMLVYSLVIVVGGQLAWFMGLKRSDAAEVSLANSFTPIAGILAAYLILGEAPTLAQYLGGGVILLGIVLNQIGVSRLPQKSITGKGSAEKMDGAVGFKGV
ncbi:MAG: DMT family transporter [Oscillatoriales cyanobacterium RM1_1_9]|nr:DMT family transporter [Oscillatoriales cyanobacterium SM2_3_0]NJO47682.1 DMT family transporter [Oscillatoriales cyanobacterium RM2_1_1]NJO72155.1 DMT family transporter [Oscillatoriales cyanobacterium RM1_1_9]